MAAPASSAASPSRADGRTLYAVHVLGRADQRDRSRRRGTVRTHGHAAGRAVHRRSSSQRRARRVFVSLWGGAKVLALDAGDAGGDAARSRSASIRTRWRCRRTASGCSSPARTPTRCGSIDSPTLTRARADSRRARFPTRRPARRRTRSRVSPDGETLAVANADNNTVAVVDIAQPGAQRGRGLHPDRLVSDRGAVRRRRPPALRAERQGAHRAGQPARPAAGSPGARTASTSGSCCRARCRSIDVPDAARARSATRSASIELSRLHRRDAADAGRRAGGVADSRAASAIRRPSSTCSTSSARTAPTIRSSAISSRATAIRRSTLFGEDVTPNAHALAREFVLFDNFYVDAEVSYDGHAFSTGAYATDVVEKLWPTNYGRRGGVYLSEGGYGDRNPYGNLVGAAATATSGTSRTRAGVACAATASSPTGPAPTPDGARASRRRVPGLKGKVHPSYPPYDLSIPDSAARRRLAGGVPAVRGERRAAAAEHHPPRQRSHLRHAAGHADAARRWWRRTTLALGRLVEAISRSRFWNESAIFVLEDDAQNGPDHVDSHRSSALVDQPVHAARRRSTARSTRRRACCGRWS